LQESIIIPSAHGTQRFGEIMAEFQRERFASINPALVAIARDERPEIGRHFWEATKGASKDSDLAVCMLWLLAFSQRPLTCQIGAADRDQADELRKAAKDVLRLNPWLAERVEIQSWKIICEATACEAEIISADVTGSHGARPDVLILNELSHIAKWEFSENLMDNASKVPNGLVVIATNAGFTGTPAFKWRELARTSDRWYFHQYAQPSPWLDDAEIDEARIRNSNERFQRLWYGIWSSGSGDALDEDDIRAAVTQAGPLIASDSRHLPGWKFIAGLDLGVKHDHSALVVLGVLHGTARIRVASIQSWKPPRGGQVDLTAVERAIVQAHRQYNLQKLLFDPNQALLMAQRVRRNAFLICEEMSFVGANLDRMATVLMETFRSRIIDMFDHQQLIRDLKRLTIEEKSYGQKLTAVSDADGHADTATALAIALPEAQRLAHFGAYELHAPTTCHVLREPQSLGVQMVRHAFSSRPGEERRIRMAPPGW